MADANQAPKDLMGFLEFYLVQKAPFQIPDNAKEWIVKFGPWITVVLLVLLLPLILFALGLSTMMMPLGGYAYAPGFSLAATFLIVNVGLMIAALPGLFARKMAGWNLLFYARIVSLIYSLMTYAIIGGLIGALIGLYILFQIRPLYK